MSERTIQEEKEYRSYWFRDDLTPEEKQRYKILGEKTINHMTLLADYGIDKLSLLELQEEYIQLYEKYDELEDEYEEYKDMYQYSEEYVDEIKSEYKSRIEELEYKINSLEDEIVELDDSIPTISNIKEGGVSTDMAVTLILIVIVVLYNFITIIYNKVKK